MPGGYFVFGLQGARGAKIPKSDLIRPTICGVPLQLLLKALFDLRPPCTFNFSLNIKTPFLHLRQKSAQKAPNGTPDPNFDGSMTLTESE